MWKKPTELSFQIQDTANKRHAPGSLSPGENLSCNRTFSWVWRRGGYFYLFGLSSSALGLEPSKAQAIHVGGRQKSEQEGEPEKRIWTHRRKGHGSLCAFIVSIFSLKYNGLITWHEFQVYNRVDNSVCCVVFTPSTAPGITKQCYYNPLTGFPMLCLSSPWLIHSITGTLCTLRRTNGTGRSWRDDEELLLQEASKNGP